MKLNKNTILITGGTSGFGFEFASQLMKLGNTVIITGRNAQKLEETKKLLPGVYTFQSDVSKVDDIISLFKKVSEDFPNLNILINNAGEMRDLILHDQHDLNDITREIAINLMGPIRMVQQFLPLLKSQSNAAIMNVSSGIALMPFPIAPVYSASKSGLRSYTQALRVQTKNTGIKIFELVAPGSDTPLNEKFKKLDGVDGFKQTSLITPAQIVEEGIKGLKNDKYEIYPGPLKLLRFFIRFFPNFFIAMASKVGAKAMAS